MMMGDKSAVLALQHRERELAHACMGFYEVAVHTAIKVMCCQHAFSGIMAVVWRS